MLRRKRSFMVSPCVPPRGGLAHVSEDRHEAGALHGHLDHALMLCAVAAPLAREQLALRVHLLGERLEVLVVHDVGLLAAEAATLPLLAAAVGSEPREAAAAAAVAAAPVAASAAAAAAAM